MAATPPNTVELDPSLMARTRKAADERGVAVPQLVSTAIDRITSYNVCYTKLLRVLGQVFLMRVARHVRQEAGPVDNPDAGIVQIRRQPFRGDERVGLSVFPEHYAIGWHITGTAGVFGAAAAAGRLLGLDARQMCWALGIAATQAAGLREMFGSMCKSLHPGRAAQNGLLAALLASNNFTSSEQAIDRITSYNVCYTKLLRRCRESRRRILSAKRSCT